METVNNTDNAKQFDTAVDAFVAVKDTHESKKERKKRSNQRYRQTTNGWLKNYYSRLKSRNNAVVTTVSSELFAEASKLSSSFRCAWEAYVESGFKRAYAPKLQSFTGEVVPQEGGGNILPAMFYA